MTDFNDLLERMTHRANQDPVGAWATREQLAALAATPEEVLHLGAWTAQVAGTVLGHFIEGAGFLAGLRQHRALTGPAAEAVRASLWRAEAVQWWCVGREEAAEKAVAAGVHTVSDRCRIEGLAAQTLASRGRFSEAVLHLRRAEEACRGLPAHDAVVAQTAQVARNILTMADHQAPLIHLLARTAASALTTAAPPGDWRHAHEALWQTARADLASGRLTPAHAAIHELSRLEDQQKAGPFERYRTAALAARLHALQGRTAAAAQALEAAQDFATRAARLGHDLEAELTDLQKIVFG